MSEQAKPLRSGSSSTESFMGHPPSGNPMEADVIALITVEQVGVLAQIGVLSAQ